MGKRQGKKARKNSSTARMRELLLELRKLYSGLESSRKKEALLRMNTRQLADIEDVKTVGVFADPT